MLQTLKWTESVFAGLAIVLLALAVIAVPSNQVWGEDPDADPGGGVVAPCSTASCRESEGQCKVNCADFPCSEGGADPKKAICRTLSVSGCVCYTP